LICLLLMAAGPAAAKPRSKAPRKAAEAAETAGASAPAPVAQPEPSMPAVEAQAPSTPASEPIAAPAAPPPPAAASGVEPAAPKLSAEQLAALRAESSQLIDDMAQARAKAALLGKTLWKTQLRVRVQNLAGPDPRLTKVVLKLDGAPVFVGDAAAISGDDAHQVFEGFIAPGQHVLTAELKQQSRSDATFGYSLHDTYNFKAQRDKLSELTLIVDDDSDMADDYPDDGKGEYDVRLKLRVRTKNIGEE
jgi:hypothetical protein